MCLSVTYKYGCGHVNFAKAPCATSRSALCGINNVKIVKHDESCDTCDLEPGPSDGPSLTFSAESASESDPVDSSDKHGYLAPEFPPTMDLLIVTDPISEGMEKEVYMQEQDGEAPLGKSQVLAKSEQPSHLHPFSTQTGRPHYVNPMELEFSPNPVILGHLLAYQTERTVLHTSDASVGNIYHYSQAGDSVHQIMTSMNLMNTDSTTFPLELALLDTPPTSVERTSMGQVNKYKTNLRKIEVESGTIQEKTVQRRTLQHRIAQSKYRQALQKRLEDHEHYTGSLNRGHLNFMANTQNAVDPQVFAYQRPADVVQIECVCANGNDLRFVTPCVTCGRWQHLPCYYGLARDPVEGHECIQCSPVDLTGHTKRSLKVTDLKGLERESYITAARSRKRAKITGSVSSINIEDEPSNPSSDPTSPHNPKRGEATHYLSHSISPTRSSMSTVPGTQTASQSLTYIGTGAEGPQETTRRHSKRKFAEEDINQHLERQELCPKCDRRAVNCDGHVQETHGTPTIDFSLGDSIDKGPTAIIQVPGEPPTPDTMASIKARKLKGTTKHANEMHQMREGSRATPISPTRELARCGSHAESPTVFAEVEEQNREVLREARILTYASDLLQHDWTQVQDLLPETWKWDVEYQTRCWTCTPIDPLKPANYPLAVGGSPVVLPVEYHWPPMGGINPPPDPRPSSPIDYRAALPMDVARDVLLTFKGSVGFYLLINGLLQLIVPEEFDTSWAASHLPHKYAGLKVCYIAQSMEPTMFAPSATETSQSKPTLTSKKPGLSNHLRQSRSSSASLGLPLKLNDFIEARPKSGHRREKYAARVGLKVARAGEPYLVTSTHIITETILAKSHRTAIFPRTRNRFDKLDENWNEHVDIWAHNEKIGTVHKSFDEEAEVYPNGFCHDVTLIKPFTPASTKDVASPISDIGWLNHESWSSLRQQTSAVKILGPTEAHRTSKSIKCSRPSEILVVGEGIFLNQTAAAGSSKALKDHDMSTWKSLVSRALLYRVYPDFDPPNGYSGVALYADGTRQDGTVGPGIVGFQSFVQRSGHVQNFNMEGSALDKRLQLGRVAFYGAFEVPEELKRDYTVV